ncbi:hypothetical protein [Cryptosporangium phraense]|uniref:Uncharacterized protein n=1 Tax=Cryptosporangium phraense TaxID=2593070 RepID=A0A545AUS0_9ACTN|nr:hypothetical protein [Cryptosporangium phraense]TQS44335.1 hypothetical protein FL583_15495 [Cryptosporangium phraense]
MTVVRHEPSTAVVPVATPTAPVRLLDVAVRPLAAVPEILRRPSNWPAAVVGLAALTVLVGTGLVAALHSWWALLTAVLFLYLAVSAIRTTA